MQTIFVGDPVTVSIVFPRLIPGSATVSMKWMSPDGKRGEVPAFVDTSNRGKVFHHFKRGVLNTPGSWSFQVYIDDGDNSGHSDIYQLRVVSPL